MWAEKPPNAQSQTLEFYRLLEDAWQPAAEAARGETLTGHAARNAAGDPVGGHESRGENALEAGGGIFLGQEG